MKNDVVWAAGAVVLVFCVWLALPQRNLEGDPRREKLHAQCQLSDGTRVRLYHGEDGSDPRVSPWYTVTTKPSFLGREHQVAFSYGVPRWERLVCDEWGISLYGRDGAIALPFDELEARRSKPIRYWHGVLDKTSPGFVLFDGMRLAVAAEILLFAGWFILKTRLGSRLGSDRGEPEARKPE